MKSLGIKKANVYSVVLIIKFCYLFSLPPLFFSTYGIDGKGGGVSPILPSLPWKRSGSFEGVWSGGIFYRVMCVHKHTHY